MSNEVSANAFVRLRSLLFGYMVTQCLSIVARLGIADQLASGPLRVEELAARTGVDADALFRVMRAVASYGVFEETSERHFAQTTLSASLCDDARPSIRHLAIFFGGDMYKVWGGAFDAVKSGEPIFEKMFGLKHFDYLSQNPKSLETFTKAMAGAARGRIAALMQADWTSVKRVVDVGGGDGTLLLELLEGQPHLEGVVFDLPELRARAEEKIGRAALEKRCSFQAGSFLTDSPPPADAYVFARVLHNWDDDDAKGILGRVRQAAHAGGRVTIIDDVLSGGAEPDIGKLLDLQMLVVLGGRERTAEEWRVLLGGAGFEVASIRRDPGWGGLIEGRAV